jgi:hypothetical protein
MAIIGAVAVALPLAIVLLADPAPRSPVRMVRFPTGNIEAPISSSLTPHADVSKGAVKFAWQATKASGRTKVVYGLIRSAGGDGCTLPTEGAGECLLDARITTWTPNLTVTDRPGHGSFWYRIAAIADNRAHRFSSDGMLIGPAIRVRV